MADIIPLQQKLSQPIPEVIGNLDYQLFKENLYRINELLYLSGIDNKVMQYDIDQAEQYAIKEAEDKNKKYKGLCYKQKHKIQLKAKQKLRYIILRKLTGESYRNHSCQLAQSFLFQKFCLIDNLDKIKVPSKSSLERYEKEMPEKIIRELNIILMESAKAPVDTKKLIQKLLLKEEVNVDDYYFDATCVKANIHYPVDWVLLRDATKTIMKAVALIRKQGLKNRMQSPFVFITEINKLCIQMTHARNKKGSKKKRKMILRIMKKLLKKVRNHGEKHKDILIYNWEQTGLSRKQANRIIERMDNVLKKLPEAMKQAHERIIGERLVKNKDKILSLYDENVNVIVRGKPEAKVEFGNTLVIGEISNGLIIDWKLYKDTACAETKLLPESLERLKCDYNGYKPKNVATDRGCDSAKNSKYLKTKEITNYMCPRSPQELDLKLKDENFKYHQKRRGQTEARIGIFKNNFLGNPLKSKEFGNKKTSVAWSILAHNLWVLARLPKVEVVKPKILKKAS